MIPAPFRSLQMLRLIGCMTLSTLDVACPGEQGGDGERRAALTAKVKRVIFLGDSITYSGGYVGLLEAYFVTRYPGRTIEFINVGLPSETVSGLSEEGHAGGQFPRPDLHERLGRVLEQIRPDLVFACYGMNDGIYLPFNEERFEVQTRDGMGARPSDERGRDYYSCDAADI